MLRLLAKSVLVRSLQPHHPSSFYQCMLTACSRRVHMLTGSGFSRRAAQVSSSSPLRSGILLFLCLGPLPADGPTCIMMQRRHIVLCIQLTLWWLSCTGFACACKPLQYQPHAQQCLLVQTGGESNLSARLKHLHRLTHGCNGGAQGTHAMCSPHSHAR